MAKKTKKDKKHRKDPPKLKDKKAVLRVQYRQRPPVNDEQILDNQSVDEETGDTEFDRIKNLLAMVLNRAGSLQGSIDSIRDRTEVAISNIASVQRTVNDLRAEFDDFVEEKFDTATMESVVKQLTDNVKEILDENFIEVERLVTNENVSIRDENQEREDKVLSAVLEIVTLLKGKKK